MSRVYGFGAAVFLTLGAGFRASPIHPGEILLEESLKPLNISQYRLAKDIGVSLHRINEFVQGANTPMKLMVAYSARSLSAER